MERTGAASLLIGFAAFAAVFAVSPRGAVAAADDQVARGEYLVRAGACIACHTDIKGKGAPLAGGRGLKTPFGVYYSPNITPDRKTGIGGWSDRDFLNALQHGIRPDGGHYFPVFPYTTYTRMTDADALAIKAYLFSLEPVAKQNRAHDVWPPFSWRWPLAGWKWLYFTEGRHKPDATKDKVWNRGAYLVEALAHCGECHTARNLVGGLDRSKWMAGTRNGPEGEIAANITSDAETGIGEWSEDEIVTLLREATKPDYDNVQGVMEEAIERGFRHLGDADLNAIARYIKSLPPIRNKVEK